MSWNSSFVGRLLLRDSGIFLVIPSETVQRSEVRTRYSARAVKRCGYAHISVGEGALAKSSLHGFMPGTAFYENVTSPAQRTPPCRAFLCDSATSYRTFDDTSSCISYAKSISTQNQPCNKMAMVIPSQICSSSICPAHTKITKITKILSCSIPTSYKIHHKLFLVIAIYCSLFFSFSNPLQYTWP